MTGSVELVCQRCLKPMRYSFDEAFELVLVEVGEEELGVPESREVVVLEAGRLDAQWLIEEQLLLALPLIPRHEDEAECKALASAGSGQSAKVREDPDAGVDRQRPFQNLRELLRKG